MNVHNNNNQKLNMKCLRLTSLLRNVGWSKYELAEQFDCARESPVSVTENIYKYCFSSGWNLSLSGAGDPPALF